MDTPGWSSLLLAAVPSDNLTLPVVTLIIALLICAIASAAETALTTSNRIRIKVLAEEGDERAQQIQKLLAKPDSYLTAILVINNVAVILASSLATLIALTLSPQWGNVIATLATSLVVLIFCEITPKTAAVQNSETWARSLVPLVSGMTWLLRPVVFTLTGITGALLRAAHVPEHRLGPSLTEEEILQTVSVGREEGVIQEEERTMINNIIELDETVVREIMVPRIDMVTLEADATIDEAIDLITQGGQSRIPVYEDTIDNIIGLLYAKDLLRHWRERPQPDMTVRSLLRNAIFIPESKKVDDLLREMRGERVHMAIVTDEFGSVSGLVTIEDIVEEIIGDIQDEYDREEKEFERLGPNEYVVAAKLNIDDFNELTGAELEAEEGFDTVGGFVLGRLDKIPSVGDVVRAGDVTLTVLATRGRRVLSLKAVLHSPAASDSAHPDGSQDAAHSHAADAASPRRPQKPSGSNITPFPHSA
jgi:putative hemolysin